MASKKQDLFLLPDEITRSNVGVLREGFLKWIHKTGPINIDGKNVRVIDSPGVQLLLSLKITAQKEGKKVYFLSLSKALEEAIEAHHCENYLK